MKTVAEFKEMVKTVGFVENGKDVPANTIVGGVPAKPIKQIA